MPMRNGLLQELSHERKTASNSNAGLWWPPCDKVSRCVSWLDSSMSASAPSRSGWRVPTANPWNVPIGPIGLAEVGFLPWQPHLLIDRLQAALQGVPRVTTFDCHVVTREQNG